MYGADLADLDSYATRYRGITSSTPPHSRWVSEDGWGLGSGTHLSDGRTVLRRLGGGSEHEVMLVKDRRYGVCVAKLARPSLVRDGLSCTVLAREANAMLSVSHGTVVACLDVDLVGPFPHLLLEYVPGFTLRETLRASGPLGPRATLTLGVGMAQALAAVASAGWMHLDVKPENLIVSPARLIDFSVSCRINDREARSLGVGTPAYMAPEQLGSDAATMEIGPAADVYALGTTLIEALTNQPAQPGVPDHISPALRGALLATRSRVRAWRPSAAELAGVFEHELSLVAGGHLAAGDGLPSEWPGSGNGWC